MNSIKYYTFLLLTIALCAAATVHGQSLAVKSNLLYDATGTLNIGVEGATASRWTVGADINYNPWTYGNDTKVRQLSIAPQAKYWFCQPFTGHFLSVDAYGGIFNLGHIGIMNLDKDKRYEGWFVGGGISYGYDWILSPRWNIEASVGVGYIRSDYQTYRCTHCGKKIGERRPSNYVGPTKAAVSIIYLIK